jgi:hypothetical protein
MSITVMRRERKKVTWFQWGTRQLELSGLVKLVCLHPNSVFVGSLIFLSIIATEYGRYQYDILQAIMIG